MAGNLTILIPGEAGTEAFITATLNQGTAQTTGPPLTAALWIMTDLDVTFLGGTQSSFEWFDGANHRILVWQPTGTQGQSFHWSGFQGITSSQHWTFQTIGGPTVFEVVGWGVFIPSPSGV